MRAIYLIAAVTAALMLRTASTEPPMAPVAFPFRMDRQEAASFEFRTRETRSYTMTLQSGYVDTAGLYRTLKLLGEGCEGAQECQGIVLPVQLRITKLSDDGSSDQQICNDTINTQSIYAHGSHKDGSGHYLRRIIAINLEPGAYRANLRVVEDKTEFQGYQVQFAVDTHYDIKSLPYAIWPASH